MSSANRIGVMQTAQRWDKTMCIGFGEFEMVCPNKAGSTHSPLWCQRCDDLRREHITKRLKELTR